MHIKAKFVNFVQVFCTSITLYLLCITITLPVAISLHDYRHGLVYNRLKTCMSGLSLLAASSGTKLPVTGVVHPPPTRQGSPMCDQARSHPLFCLPYNLRKYIRQLSTAIYIFRLDFLRARFEASHHHTSETFRRRLLLVW